MDLSPNPLCSSRELPRASGNGDGVQTLLEEILEPIRDEVLEMRHGSDMAAAIGLLAAFSAKAHRESFAL